MMVPSSDQGVKLQSWQPVSLRVSAQQMSSRQESYSGSDCRQHLPLKQENCSRAEAGSSQEHHEAAGGACTLCPTRL